MVEKVTNQFNYFNELAILFDSYRVFYRKEANLKQAKEFLEERINNNESVIYIIRTNSGSIMGFVQLYPLFSSTRMKRLWLLNDLFVAEEHRGKGYSKQLIEAAKKHCKKTDYCGVMLETEKSNVIANKLYDTTNFEIDNEHNFYFWNS